MPCPDFVKFHKVLNLLNHKAWSRRRGHAFLRAICEDNPERRFGAVIRFTEAGTRPGVTRHLTFTQFRR
ncbi:hypothetical protein LNA02_20100 [Levilactobacillus namurensis]|nr:hypothetical protein LNA02_20100 [Levilactobacillus namurensis]